MDKLKAYLSVNWKHLAVVLVIAIYNALATANVIPANYQALITALLAAFGVSLTSSSGTKDKISSATKFLIIGFMIMLPLIGSAQPSTPQQMTGKRGTLGDTITNTGTAYDSISLNNPWAAGSIVTTIKKISGTVSPTVILQASADGVNWTVFGQDSLILSNATGTQAFTWVLPGLPWKARTTGSTVYTQTAPVLPFLYYRVLATGTGTMSAIIKSWMTIR